MPENRRVKMTKHLIKEAYVDILAERPEGKVSVTEVCERADVNRSTFYTHYKDLKALFAEIEEDVLQHIPVLVPEADPDYLSKNRALLQEFFAYLMSHPRLFMLLTSEKSDREWEFKLASVLFRDFRPQGVSDADSLTYYEYIFCVMGTLGATREWIKMGCPVSAERFGALMFECCRKSMTKAYTLPA